MVVFRSEAEWFRTTDGAVIPPELVEQLDRSFSTDTFCELDIVTVQDQDDTAELIRLGRAYAKRLGNSFLFAYIEPTDDSPQKIRYKMRKKRKWTRRSQS